MPIHVICPHCRRDYNLSDELLGKRFRCKGCLEIVEASPSLRAGMSASGGPRASGAKGKAAGKPARPGIRQDPVKGRSAARKAGRQKSSNDFDYEVEDYRIVDETDVYDDYVSDAAVADAEAADPWSIAGTSSSSSAGSRRSRRRGATTRKTRPSSGSWQFGFNIGRLNVAMAVIGFVLLMIGSMEFSLARKSGSTPVAMTLSELLQNGPGSSIYLTVSGIEPASDGFVYEQSTRAGISRYTKVYVPCRAAGSGNNSPVRFILFSAKTADDSAVNQLMSQSTHTGMIINTIRKLGSEELNLLQSGIPNANLREAIIFESGRKPSGVLLCVLMLGAGLALLAGGAFLIFVRRH